jgi:hypothetical protein
MLLLQKTTIPRSEKLKPGFFLGNGMREWLENYLEERFEVAERWQNESWMTAWGLEHAAVEEIVRLMGLRLERYGVWGAREMEVQRAWRRSGDWRAGSTPCFCKGLVDVDVDDPGSWGRLGAIGSEREEALRALRNGTVGVDSGGVVEEERDVAEKVEKVIPTVSSVGEEKTVETPEGAPLLKDGSDRIRVPRVLKRGEKIPDNWWEECE